MDWMGSVKPKQETKKKEDGKRKKEINVKPATTQA